jgi:hypothetical protein
MEAEIDRPPAPGNSGAASGGVEGGKIGAAGLVASPSKCQKCDPFTLEPDG